MYEPVRTICSLLITLCNVLLAELRIYLFIYLSDELKQVKFAIYTNYDAGCRNAVVVVLISVALLPN
jgi:hypothetical protein